MIKPLLEKVNSKVNDIIAQISEEKNLDIVIPSSQTLYYRDSIDISAEVLKRLNSALTTIDVKFK
ncbi:MAG: OmpH family outer membrane protein [Proteobacteria bacterium]|nr:OmpH family outer membrane protein [Pseudomonadota bacterium]